MTFFRYGILIEALFCAVATVLRYENQQLPLAAFDAMKHGNLASAVFFLMLSLLYVAGCRRAEESAKKTHIPLSLTLGIIAGIFVAAVMIFPEHYALLLAVAAVAKLLQTALLAELAFYPNISEHFSAVFFLRILLGALFFSALLISAGFTYTFSSAEVYQNYEAIPQKYDAGVILGAAVWKKNKPSPVLNERIRAGFELLSTSKVDFLILTGGNAPYELAEAVVARNELLKLGADSSRLIVETHSSSTLEQILYIREEMPLHNLSSFLMISDEFHLRRILEMCQFNNIRAVGVASQSPLGRQTTFFYRIRESIALMMYWMFGV